MSWVDDSRDNEWGSSGRGTHAPRRSPQSADPPITVHESDGSHTVFTESGNSDAWIATDFVVDVER